MEQSLSLQDLLAWNHARHFNYRAKLYGQTLASVFTGKEPKIDEEKLRAEILAEQEAAKKIIEKYEAD